jgi:hypothetical protein
MTHHCTVHAHWDAMSKTWWTDGEDVPGLTCQAETFDELVIHDLAPELAQANAGVARGERIEITIVAERQATCTAS